MSVANLRESYHKLYIHFRLMFFLISYLLFSSLYASEIREDELTKYKNVFRTIEDKKNFFMGETELPGEIVVHILDAVKSQYPAEDVITLIRFAIVNKEAFTLARSTWKNKWKKEELIISCYPFSGSSLQEMSLHPIFNRITKYSRDLSSLNFNNVNVHISYKDIRAFNAVTFLTLISDELNITSNHEFASRLAHAKKLRVRGSYPFIQEGRERIAINKLTSVLRSYPHQLSLLSLEGVDADDKDGLLIDNILKSQTSLNELVLKEYKIYKLDTLRHLQNLEKLNLSFNFLQNHEAQVLSSLINLKSLTLIGSMIKKEGAYPLSVLTNLNFLDLTIDNIEEVEIITLSTLTKLNSLRLGNFMGDAGLKALPLLPHLQCLDLIYNDITDEGIPHLLKYTTLKSLNFDHNKLSNNSIPYLREFTNLTSLNIKHNEISREWAETLLQWIWTIEFDTGPHSSVEYKPVSGWQVRNIEFPIY